ncbi:MAG TPA: SRPBCC domain-containing protein [Actinomycetes bacterium]|nr:SRPBCC domain-containing protein [Actinomycetes bacterium]
MSSDRDDTPRTRAIELDVEVPGTPEEVWEAVASGPGISAWFVPAKVDGRVGGTVELDFGPGYGTQAARITTWDPPRRFVAEVTGEGRPTFAAEWLVEARDGGTCVVRLINSGFGSGAEWDAEYDATEAGWRLFLYNLRLYLTHFPGQRCSSILVNGKAAGPVDRAFGELAAALGLPTGAGEGDRLAATAPGAPQLDGVVERAEPNMLTLLLDKPAPGVGFVVAEPIGDGTAHASLYAYLFGDGAAEVAARDEPAWRAWMQRHFPMPEQPAGS